MSHLLTEKEGESVSWDVKSFRSEYGGILTAVIECFSCTVTEAVGFGDLFKTSDLASSLHSISQGSVCELLLQGDSNPIHFAHCLAEHKLIENFIFKFEFLLSESL